MQVPKSTAAIALNNFYNAKAKSIFSPERYEHILLNLTKTFFANKPEHSIMSILKNLKDIVF